MTLLCVGGVWSMWKRLTSERRFVVHVLVKFVSHIEIE
jgi:hypothetical protein